MELSDYLILGLLIIIAALLVIGILMLIRLYRANQSSKASQGPTMVNEELTTVEYQPASQEIISEDPDPIGLYLQHLDKVCQSVEPIGNNECKLILAEWSLAYTLQMVRNHRYYDKPPEEQPRMNLYFILHEDYSWQLTDRGENRRSAGEINLKVQKEMDAFRQNNEKTKTQTAPGGILSASGINYQTFEDSLDEMRQLVKTMDEHWTPLVHNQEGLIPWTMEEIDGQRMEFTAVTSSTNMPQMTRSFSLKQGALVYQFESKATLSDDGKEAELFLARDKPGWFGRKHAPLPIQRFAKHHRSMACSRRRMA